MAERILDYILHRRDEAVSSESLRTAEKSATFQEMDSDLFLAQLKTIYGNSSPNALCYKI